MRMALKKIKKAFVDREDALNFLEKELDERIDDAVEIAIRITQAPGTGKTRLLKEFIKKMEREGKAVGIYINSPEIEDWITGSLTNLESILWRAVFLPVAKEVLDVEQLDIIDVKGLLKKYDLNEYIPYSKFQIILEENLTYDNMLVTFSSRLPNAIGRPLIIVFDEIQATIGRMTDHFQNEKGQGLFRNIINLVSKLIKRKNVLVVLSGTNYKIMHYLEDLGSPLKQKTMEYNLKPLAPEYVGEFYDKVFGNPVDETTTSLRNWLIENSNGVPRTMVWMAKALERQGGVDWARKVGVENAIKILDDAVYNMVLEDVQNSVRSLMELNNGKELLEWVAYRSLFDRQISLVETRQFDFEEADRKKICTIDDLIHKGIIHLVDGHFEFRNVYFEQALRDALQIENKTLDELLKLFGMKTTELRGFMSWQRTFLGAYLELALSIAMYRMSQQLGDIDLSKFLTPQIDNLKVRVNKIIRIASPELIEKPETNMIYAAPERGPDLTIFTEDKKVILIECKNWTKPLALREFQTIHMKFNEISEKFKSYRPIYIIAIPKIQDIIFDELEQYSDTYFMLEESLKQILGEQVFAMFDEVRQLTLQIRKIL